MSVEERMTAVAAEAAMTALTSSSGLFCFLAFAAETVAVSLADNFAVA